MRSGRVAVNMSALQRTPGWGSRQKPAGGVVLDMIRASKEEELIHWKKLTGRSTLYKHLKSPKILKMHNYRKCVEQIKTGFYFF